MNEITTTVPGPTGSPDPLFSTIQTWDGNIFQVLRQASDSDGRPVVDDGGEPVMVWDEAGTAAAVNAWVTVHPDPTEVFL